MEPSAKADVARGLGLAGALTINFCFGVARDQDRNRLRLTDSVRAGDLFQGLVVFPVADCVHRSTILHHAKSLIVVHPRGANATSCAVNKDPDRRRGQRWRTDRNCFINCITEGSGEHGVFISDGDSDQADPEPDATENTFLTTYIGTSRFWGSSKMVYGASTTVSRAAYSAGMAVGKLWIGPRHAPLSRNPFSPTTPNPQRPVLADPHMTAPTCTA